MAPVDAAPVRAHQVVRKLRHLGRFQADHRIELRAQRPVRQLLQQSGGTSGVTASPRQDPAEVLNQVRARPGALLLLGQGERLLSGAAQRQCFLARSGRLRLVVRRVAGGCVPDRGSDRGERDAERPRELVGPARVQLLGVERAFLAPARGEVRRLRELRQLPLRRGATVTLLEPRGAAAQVRGDRLAARGEHAHHLPADAFDLEAVAVIAGRPLKPEPPGEGFLEVLRGHRADRSDVLVVTEGVRGAPLPVFGCPGGVGDLRVDVQLHVAIPGRVLQPVRDREVGLVPLTRLAPVDPRVVGAGTGVARLLL